MRKGLRRRLLHPQRPSVLARLHSVRKRAVTEPGFRIRPATLRDYIGLCEVFQEADLMHSSALPDLFRATPGPARTREYVAEIIGSENSVVFVAEQDGRIIGAARAEIREAPTIPLLVPRRFGLIDTLVVTRSCRRRGIGTALAQEVQRWASGKAVSHLELTVYEFNRSGLAFYQKLGFRTASRRLRKSLS
jgi:ribosomal protein S18 acetylase RimI-like enzyme